MLAGDSAGGYLALALAQRLQAEGEEPAALVAISPLLQLDHQPKLSHPNIHSDALFSARAFDALVALVARAAAKNVVDGEPEGVYEPLDHIEPGLPRTLIHVSGSEVLLHDARLAARRLAAAGVPPRSGCGPARSTTSRWRPRSSRRRPARYARSASTSAKPPNEHRLTPCRHAYRAACQ